VEVRTIELVAIFVRSYWLMLLLATTRVLALERSEANTQRAIQTSTEESGWQATKLHGTGNNLILERGRIWTSMYFATNKRG
jgi:hypothetical protein